MLAAQRGRRNRRSRPPFSRSRTRTAASPRRRAPTRASRPGGCSERAPRSVSRRPAPGINRLALVVLGLLAAFAVWILISVNWATDAERAFAQFNQVSLYVAVLALSIVLARLVPATWVVGGVALALASIAGVALVSRCFPSTLRPRSPVGRSCRRWGRPAQLPARLLERPRDRGRARLPAAARDHDLATLARRERRGRISAADPRRRHVPHLVARRVRRRRSGGADRSSCSPRDAGRPLAALLVAGAAGAVAVAALVHKNALVNGTDGHRARGAPGSPRGALIGVACVVTALVWAGLAELGKRLSDAAASRRGRRSPSRSSSSPSWRSSPSHPVRKFDAVQEQLRRGGIARQLHDQPSAEQLRQRALAVLERGGLAVPGPSAQRRRRRFLARPGGSSTARCPSRASSRTRSISRRSAELGILGFLLIVGAVLVAVVGRDPVRARAAERRDRRGGRLRDRLLRGRRVRLGLAAGGYRDRRCRDARLRARGAPRRARRRVGAFGALRPALALVAVAAIIPQYVVLAAGSHLSNSQAAYSAGDGARARSEALAAKAIEPWAASPYLQLGFVAEAEGNLRRGRALGGRGDPALETRLEPVGQRRASFEAEAGNVRGRETRPRRGAPPQPALEGSCGERRVNE